MHLPRIEARERRALLLSPLVAPVGYWLGLVGATALRAVTEPNEYHYLPPIRALGFSLASGSPIAYLSMVVAGLPAYLMLRRAGRVSRLWLWAVGACIGGAVALVLRPSLRGELFSIPFPLWSGVILGLATAEVFLRLLGLDAGRPSDSDAANWQGP